MYNCEAVVSESERVRTHMCVSSRECAREAIHGKEVEPQLSRSVVGNCVIAKSSDECLGRCWPVATGCTVFVPGMK